MCLRFLGGPIALLIFSSAAIAQTTGTTGGSSPFDNQQPSLAVTQFLLKQGLFPAQASEFPDAGAAGMTLGFVYSFGGGFTPGSTVNANGQLLSISQNIPLFAVLGGTTYGGNGQTTFALPDFRGRTMVAADYTLLALGDVFGTASNVLTVANLAAHNHSLEIGPVSEVPLPAALPLFATGLGALGLRGWRRKKKAAARAA